MATLPVTACGTSVAVKPVVRFGGFWRISLMRGGVEEHRKPRTLLVVVAVPSSCNGASVPPEKKDK
eukprot:1470067-Amphidinium_carterae.1